MKVLSLFDGISCARVALARAGFLSVGYFASEIEPNAIKIAQKNYPDTKQIGSVLDVKCENGGIVWAGGGFTFSTKIDLLIGGSPCQDLSIAKSNRKGLSGERSGLFWEYVRILEATKPKWFVLENVARMPKKDREEISRVLGVQPIMIDAALVSAQSRKRLFWTNIPNIVQPKDKLIFLKDIIEYGYTPDPKSYAITATQSKKTARDYFLKGHGQMIFNKPVFIENRGKGGGISTRIYSIDGKSVTLKALGGGGGAKTGLYLIRDQVRSLTATECERLQCLPDGYTDTGDVAKTNRITCLGNAFNVDVVAHILSFIPKK